MINVVPRKEDISVLVSGFRRKVDEKCAFLVYDAACSGNSLPTFRDNLILDDGTDLDP
jgi:hypothetical protein